MTIKMKQTTKGSPDGKNVLEYVKDREYQMPDGLAKTFIGMGVATEVTHKAKEAENKKKEAESKKAKEAENKKVKVKENK